MEKLNDFCELNTPAADPGVPSLLVDLMYGCHVLPSYRAELNAPWP